MKKIAIIWGGDSSEYEVSRKSGMGIYSFFNKEKYDCRLVCLKKGEWYVETAAGGKAEIDKNDFSYTENGEKKTFEIIPVLHTYEVENEETKETETVTKYMIGFSWSYARTKVGTIETVGYSLNEVWYWIKLTVKSLGMMFTGQVTVNDLSGPVGIAEVVNDTVEQSKQDGVLYIFLNLINLSVLLSADIGVMNLLPIPALDGGRLMFLFIEAVRGKPIDKKKEGYVHLAGIIFLLLLMIFVLFNDFRKILM